MERHYIYIYIFTTPILLLILKLLIGYRWQQRRGLNLPPGPWKLPIIGSMHHLGSLPHRSLRDLSKTLGPIVHLQLGEVSTVVISSPEAAREIMKTHDVTFATRPLTPAVKILTYGGNDMIFAPYGDFWRQLRRICVLELLSLKRVHSFRPIREEEVVAIIRSISDHAAASSSSSRRHTVNLSEKLRSVVNNITTRAIIGNKCKEQDMFLSALNESVEVAGGFDVADLFPSSLLVRLFSAFNTRAERCVEKVDLILDSIIEEHREKKMRSASTGAQGEEDLLDILLRLQEGGGLEFPLTTNRFNFQLKNESQDLVGAGSETSSTILDWTMSELGYLKLVIKESMRLHIPVPLLLPRECQQACQVLGYEIPAKTRVLVNAWAIGRDPQYWEHAEEFIPERFQGSTMDFKGAHFEFLPFGSGRRMCPGILFGVANLELVLAHLLYYFDWEIPPGGAKPNEIDMGEAFGATVRRSSDLWLHAISRIPCPAP